MPSASIGPLKGLRFRFANMRPGEGGGCCPNAAPPSLRPPLTASPRRKLEGKEAFVGVAGRTFTEACGDLVMEGLRPFTEIEGEVMLTEEVEEALEWV